LEFFRNRTRVVTNFVPLFFSSAFFSYFFLLTLFEQQNLGWSPLKGGLSCLPFGLTIGAGIGIGTALMPKVGVKPLLAAGFALAGIGLFITSGIGLDTTYVPGMVVIGFGSGLSFPAIGNAALHQVTAQDSSLASGVQAAMQQVGGALGLATIVTLALRHADGQVRDGVLPGLALTHGYALGFRVGAALLIVGAVLVMLLLEHVVAKPRNALAEVEA
jgi:MFS family permease